MAKSRSGTSTPPADPIEALQWMILTDRDEDGNKKLTAEVKIEAGAGNLLVSLIDHHEGKRLVCTSGTLAEALQRLGKAFSDPEGTWLPYTSRKPKPRKEKSN